MRARHGVGHGVDPELGGLGRRRACQSGRLSPRQSASDGRPHTAGRATINNKHQFDCFRKPGLIPSSLSPGDLRPRSHDASPVSCADLGPDWDSDRQTAPARRSPGPQTAAEPEGRRRFWSLHSSFATQQQRAFADVNGSINRPGVPVRYQDAQC
jgi:hypothetical protein